MEIILASNLKYIREKFDLSQEQIAKLINKKKSVIGNYEKGISSPTLDTLVRISTYFGISLDDLVREDLKGKEENLLNFLKETKGTLLANEPTGAYQPTRKNYLTKEEKDADQEQTIRKLEKEVSDLKEDMMLFSNFHKILLIKYDDLHIKMKSSK